METPTSTALVIATWSGSRSYMDPRYAPESGRSYFVEQQVSTLSTLSHKLSAIIFAVPDNPTEPKNFTRAIDFLPDRIGGARVIISRGPNRGLSYGSFLRVVEEYPDYDDYIFLEDDYVFKLDNFDSKLSEVRASIERGGVDCSYLCGGIRFWNDSNTRNLGRLGIGGTFTIPGPSNGLIRGSAARAVLSRWRAIEDNDSAGIVDVIKARRLKEGWRGKNKPQVIFGYLFNGVAKICDFSGYYSVLHQKHWNTRNRSRGQRPPMDPIRLHGSLPVIIAPSGWNGKRGRKKKENQMSKEKIKSLVLIASPPRSLSSVTTNLVESHGFFLGKHKTFRKGRKNVYGYFENTALFELHEKAISRKIWAPKERSEEIDIEGLSKELYEIFKREFLGDHFHTHIAIKDPRLFQIPWIYTRAIKSLIEDNGPIEVKIVHIWRSKEATASSISLFRAARAPRHPRIAGEVWSGYHKQIESAVNIFQKELGASVFLLPAVALANSPEYTSKILGDFLGKYNDDAWTVFKGDSLHNGP